MNRKKLIKQLGRHEAFRSKMYKCSQGYNTIGYGLNLDAGIDEELASHILAFQIERLNETLLKEFGWYKNLDDVRANVIVNMVFNLGLEGFKKFKKTIEYIASGDYIMASKEMLNSLWATQVGYRAKELSEQLKTGQFM